MSVESSNCDFCSYAFVPVLHVSCPEFDYFGVFSFFQICRKLIRFSANDCKRDLFIRLNAHKTSGLTIVGFCIRKSVIHLLTSRQWGRTQKRSVGSLVSHVDSDSICDSACRDTMHIFRRARANL